LFLKCENLQRTGAFKFRGATHAIARLRRQGVNGDVATESSGNHGASLSMAASLDGRTAHVVMPHNSVPAKIAAVRRNGGVIYFCEPSHESRNEGLENLIDEGYIPIHPYDNADIIAGQGTAGLEIIDQVENLDAIITPIGGGGLISGVSIAAAASGIETFGAEPEGAADTYASFQSGKKVDSWAPDTIADGLRALIGTMNTVIAAIKRYPEQFRGRRVCAVITGGNIDPDFWVSTIREGAADG
jgi:threonine dehydratase